jgi:hypothetical protein
MQTMAPLGGYRPPGMPVMPPPAQVSPTVAPPLAVSANRLAPCGRRAHGRLRPPTRVVSALSLSPVSRLSIHSSTTACRCWVCRAAVRRPPPSTARVLSARAVCLRTRVRTPRSYTPHHPLLFPPAITVQCISYSLSLPSLRLLSTRRSETVQNATLLISIVHALPLPRPPSLVVRLLCTCVLLRR